MFCTNACVRKRQSTYVTIMLQVPVVAEATAAGAEVAKAALAQPDGQEAAIAKLAAEQKLADAQAAKQQAEQQLAAEKAAKQKAEQQLAASLLVVRKKIESAKALTEHATELKSKATKMNKGPSRTKVEQAATQADGDAAAAVFLAKELCVVYGLVSKMLVVTLALLCS